MCCCTGYKFKILIIILAIKTNIFSQNLIQNGGFEDNKIGELLQLSPKEMDYTLNFYSVSPVRIRINNTVKHWYCFKKYLNQEQYEFINIEDYQTIIDTRYDEIKNQSNVLPKTGNCYVRNYNGISRNLLITKLAKPLIKDSTYLIEFDYHISPNGANPSIFNNGNFGVFFTVNDITTKILKGFFIEIKNHKNLKQFFVVKDYKEAVNKWAHRQFIFTADSAYQYFFIGNNHRYSSTKDDFFVCLDNISVKPIDKFSHYKPGDKFELKNISFEINSYKLKNDSYKILDEFSSFLKKNNYNIEISGHTDKTGDFKENLLLSEKRAKAVFDYLVQKGINAERMSFIGYGSTKPISKENYKNRRVEIEILSNN